MRIVALLILSCGWLSAQPPLSLSDRALLERTSPLLNGLQGYWRFEESTGTRYDRSKNGNHLTANNSPGSAASVSAVVGNAAAFVSSSSQSLTLANPSTLHASKAMTVCAWTFLTNKAAISIVAGRWNPTGNQREWMISYSQSQDRFIFEFTADGTTTIQAVDTTLGSPVLSTWYFLVGTYNGTNIVIKSNNNAGGSTATTATPISANADFAIGALVNGGTPVGFWNGKIDEVGVWNRVLTAAEQTRLYNAGSGVTHPRFKP